MTMNTQPLVSVIIPTYNRSHLLPRAIESVLNQTWQAIELVIVNDGSVDATQEVIDSYLRKDRRVVGLKNDRNMKLSHAVNAGIERSRADFLMFLDDDCEYLPECVEKKMAFLRSLSPEPAILYSNMWMEKTGAVPMVPLHLKNKLLTVDDMFNCRYPLLEPSTWLCKKDCLRRIGAFDVDLNAYTDVDLLMRALLAGECVYFFNQPVCIKHKQEGISTVTADYVERKEQFLKKQISLLRGHKKYLSRFYYALGKDLAALREFKKARDSFNQAFLCDPLAPKYFLEMAYAAMRSWFH